MNKDCNSESFKTINKTEFSTFWIQKVVDYFFYFENSMKYEKRLVG